MNGLASYLRWFSCAVLLAAHRRIEFGVALLLGGLSTPLSSAPAPASASPPGLARVASSPSTPAPAAVIPLVHLLAEAESHRAAKRDAETAVVLDRVLDRLQRGEPLPPGVELERLQLAAATAHLRVGGHTRAAELARRLTSSAPRGQRAEALWILGLALWSAGSSAEAVPVFAELASHPQGGPPALVYQAMAARTAGQLDLAVTLYQRLSDTAPQPSDGVDAALALVELHLERGSWEEAWQGLAPVARRAEAIDNVAGWALLVLRVGDGALAADDAVAASSAYQFLPNRAELLRRHDDRDRQMEVKLAGLRSLAGNGAADLESGRRLEQRRLQGAQARAELAKHEGFDASLLLRRARAFHARGQIWEAALVLERLIERHTRAAECELGFALWVRALAEAGRSGRLDTVVDRFLAAYPRSAHAAQALTLAAHAAGERGDRDRQLRWLDQALILNPPPELRETLLLLRANALMAAGRHDEARTAAARVLDEFGEGRFAEEATYLRTMAGLLAGQPRRALEELAAYRGRFPGGRFSADAQYREAAAHYALNEPDPALAILADWLERHPPEHAQRGEVFSLQGDVWVALRREDEAVAAYEQALKHPLSTEGRGYVLDELTRLHVAHREFEAASRRWEETVAGDPDPVFLVQAAYWIGRLRLQAGDTAGAVSRMAELVRPHLDHPKREDVERVLLEVARAASRPGGAGSWAEPVESWLLTPGQPASPTARARAWFVEAERASLARQPEASAGWLERMGRECPVETLPPGLLGRLGDHHRAHGNLEAARVAYQRLVTDTPKSPFADFGYVGLGEIAFAEGRTEEALSLFEAAVDRAGARFKVKEATLGRARCLYALERWAEARALFEQLASHRAWRGEVTAESVHTLGEIHARGPGPEALVQAQGFFQRVYVGYRKYAPWVARAYLRSGEVFERLGQETEALRTYRELLRDARLTDTKEAEQARRHVQRLETKAPAT